MLCPPIWQESWVESRLVFYIPPFSTNGKSFASQAPPIAIVVNVIIEEWTYNDGPTRFISILTFENSHLVNIATGNYGY